MTTQELLEQIQEIFITNNLGHTDAQISHKIVSLAKEFAKSQLERLKGQAVVLREGGEKAEGLVSIGMIDTIISELEGK